MQKNLTPILNDFIKNINPFCKDCSSSREEGEEGEGEEISLLSIPKMLLRRASTQLGFKGLGSLTQPDQEMKTRGEPQSDQSGQSVIAEETMEEIEGEEILEVKCWLYLEWLQ